MIVVHLRYEGCYIRLLQHPCNEELLFFISAPDTTRDNILFFNTYQLLVSNVLYSVMCVHVQSTERRTIYLQFEISANAFEIRTV
jgi:hypothetical protein